MKIVFIHYHLKTGGVTTVLRQQLAALAAEAEVLVLTGEASAPPPDPENTRVIHGIGYNRTLNGDETPDQVARQIRKAIHARWPGGCDLLHIHNPLLAKNRLFLQLIGHLQKDFPVFLQIHDFAEDGRPDVYDAHSAYPPDCHYGVINTRDYGILKKAGLNPQGLHLIANSITPLAAGPAEANLQGIVLYPVRAINRKNVGEALFLSCFFPPRHTLAVTQPPNSPGDKAAYDAWVRFAQSHRLRVIFEAGRKTAFHKLVASADFFLTTSISEGFGFSFLEPWTAGKMLWGRKLPAICRDFEDNGMDLDHLYTRLRIPLSWIGEKELFTTWRKSLLTRAAKFQCNVSEARLRTAFGALTRNECVDFGKLNLSLQQGVLARICSQASDKRMLIDHNPGVFGSSAFPPSVDEAEIREKIERNKCAVLTRYTPANYRKTLLAIYAKVVNTPVHHHIDKGKILAEFLDIENYSLLK